ncbi:hypothetical protein C8F04DRAFT_1193845 [Mycena alexandri]|uniref:Uncharacterized protein n=1 Tax=Mycena alexandri TaxID=1745969 RepID=A0AAD6S9S0_9AGAR|nr:hypothetical protein C8F04DRAFT_1193845 [Mycena alexandri]
MHQDLITPINPAAAAHSELDVDIPRAIYRINAQESYFSLIVYMPGQNTSCALPRQVSCFSPPSSGQSGRGHALNSTMMQGIYSHLIKTKPLNDPDPQWHHGYHTALLLKYTTFNVAPMRHAATALKNNGQDNPSLTVLPTAPATLPYQYGVKKRCTLRELITVGFQLVHWDGVYVCNPLPHPPPFPHVPSCRHPWPVPASNCGSGQRVPSSMNDGEHAGILPQLLGNHDIVRMAMYASTAFYLWAPTIQQYSHLEPNFPRSVFSAAAFNFGLQSTIGLRS